MHINNTLLYPLYISHLLRDLVNVETKHFVLSVYLILILNEWVHGGEHFLKGFQLFHSPTQVHTTRLFTCSFITNFLEIFFIPRGVPLHVVNTCEMLFHSSSQPGVVTNFIFKNAIDPVNIQTHRRCLLIITLRFLLSSSLVLYTRFPVVTFLVIRTRLFLALL